MRILARSVCNFFSDGTKAFSFFAPAVSILYTAGKAWEWPVMEAWKDLSYAWALAPLLALAMVAYVRRWKYSQSLEGNRDLQAAVDTLSDFLDDGNTRLFNGRVSNAAEHMQWSADWGGWGRQVEDHLEEFFSRAERNNFRNLVLVEIRTLPKSFDDLHNWQRCLIELQLRKIRAITMRYSTFGRPTAGAR